MIVASTVQHLPASKVRVNHFQTLSLPGGVEMRFEVHHFGWNRQRRERIMAHVIHATRNIDLLTAEDERFGPPGQPASVLRLVPFGMEPEADLQLNLYLLPVRVRMEGRPVQN